MCPSHLSVSKSEINELDFVPCHCITTVTMISRLGRALLSLSGAAPCLSYVKAQVVSDAMMSV